MDITFEEYERASEELIELFCAMSVMSVLTVFAIVLALGLCALAFFCCRSFTAKRKVFLAEKAKVEAEIAVFKAEHPEVVFQ